MREYVDESNAKRRLKVVPPGGYSVSAAAIKALRDKVGDGFGMLDCKNALVEANGDEEHAIEILRINSQETRMVVEMFQHMHPGVAFDLRVVNGCVVFINNKTQTVFAALENGNLNLYPDKG